MYTKTALKRSCVLLIVVNIFILATTYMPIRYMDLQYIASYEGEVKIYLNGRKGYSELNTVIESAGNRQMKFWIFNKELDNIRIDFEAKNKGASDITITEIKSSSLFYHDFLDVSDVVLAADVVNIGGGRFQFSGDDPGIIIQRVSSRVYEYYKILGVNFFALVLYLLFLKGISHEKCLLKTICQKILCDNNYVVKYYRESNVIILLLIIILAVAYGFKVFNLGISIDTDVAYLQGSTYQRFIGWSSQGRFGIGILKLFSPIQHFVPYLSNFLAVITLGYAALSWNYVLFTYLFKMKNKYNEAVFIGLFVTCPSYAETMNFSTYNFEVTFGLLMLSFSVKHFVLFIRKQYKSDFLLSSILLIFAVSIYQSFIFFFICISLMLVLRDYDKCLKNGLIGLSKIVGGSLGIYFVCNTLLHFVVPKSEYIEGFIRWGKVSYHDIYINIKQYFINVFTGNLYYGAEPLIVSFIACIMCIYFAQNKNNVIFMILTLCVCLVIHVFIFAGNIPIRSNFVILWFISLPLCVLLCNLCGNHRMWYKTVLLLSFVIVLYQMSTVSHLMHGEYIKAQNDYYMIQKMGYEIEAIENDFIHTHKGKPRIAFVGSRVSNINPSVTIKGEVIGRSFFEWHEPNRLVGYMNLMGHNFFAADKNELKQASDMAKNMSVWPSKDAMQINGDLIIVKLSD